jgi:hypothetical protein
MVLGGRNRIEFANLQLRTRLDIGRLGTARQKGNSRPCLTNIGGISSLRKERVLSLPIASHDCRRGEPSSRTVSSANARPATRPWSRPPIDAMVAIGVP